MWALCKNIQACYFLSTTILYCEDFANARTVIIYRARCSDHGPRDATWGSENIVIFYFSRIVRITKFIVLYVVCLESRTYILVPPIYLYFRGLKSGRWAAYRVTVVCVKLTRMLPIVTIIITISHCEVIIFWGCPRWKLCFRACVRGWVVLGLLRMLDHRDYFQVVDYSKTN